MVARFSPSAVANAAKQASKKSVKRKSYQRAAKEALDSDTVDIAVALQSSGYDKMISRLTKAADRAIAGETVVQVVEHLHGNLARAGLQFTNGDLSACLRKALQLSTSRGGGKFRATAAAQFGVLRRHNIRQGYKHAFGGELRERVVQHLPIVRQRVDALCAQARATAPGKGQKIIDTAHIGEVRLPNASKTGNKPREGLLGPDRLIGFIKRDKAATAKGIAGTLHVTAVIEVKAMSGGLAGLDQLQKFIARASQNVLEIGGKTYRISFDENTLKRLLVLPETAKDMKAIRAFAKDQGIEVVPYAKNIERAINSESEKAVGSLLQLDKALR